MTAIYQFDYMWTE